MEIVAGKVEHFPEYFENTRTEAPLATCIFHRGGSAY